MVYRQLPAWQTRIARGGIPTNSNLKILCRFGNGPAIFICAYFIKLKR